MVALFVKYIENQLIFKSSLNICPYPNIRYRKFSLYQPAYYLNSVQGKQLYWSNSRFIGKSKFHKLELIIIIIGLFIKINTAKFCMDASLAVVLLVLLNSETRWTLVVSWDNIFGAEFFNGFYSLFNNQLFKLGRSSAFSPKQV